MQIHTSRNSSTRIQDAIYSKRLEHPTTFTSLCSHNLPMPCNATKYNTDFAKKKERCNTDDNIKKKKRKHILIEALFHLLPSRHSSLKS
jgi:hypothetical protein